VESEIGKGILINIVIGKDTVITKISSSIKMRNLCLKLDSV